MTAFLHDLGPALVAEASKSRRTLSLALAFIAPALIAALNFLIYWQRGSTLVRPVRDTWLSLTQNNLVFWTLLMVPLFVTLQTALLAALEHSNKSWKHLFALPVSRAALYAAKQVAGIGLMGLSTVVLWAAIIVSGLALRQVKPGIGLEAPIPAWEILKFTLLTYVCSWLIIAIHTWIAMRWSSFVVAMSVGVAATIVAVVVVESDYLGYYPWTLPGLTMMEAMTKGTLAYGYIAAGCLGGLAAAIAGCMDFIRRDVL